MTEQAHPPAAELSHAERVEQLLDYRQQAAEMSALFGDDLEAASSLQEFMKVTLSAEGTTADVKRLSDEQRNDPELEFKQARIRELDPRADGTLSPAATEHVAEYKKGVREVVAEVGIDNDTEWLITQYGPGRGQKQIAKYKKMARQVILGNG